MSVIQRCSETAGWLFNNQHVDLVLFFSQELVHLKLHAIEVLLYSNVFLMPCLGIHILFALSCSGNQHNLSTCCVTA